MTAEEKLADQVNKIFTDAEEKNREYLTGAVEQMNRCIEARDEEALKRVFRKMIHDGYEEEAGQLFSVLVLLSATPIIAVALMLSDDEEDE